MGADGSIIFKVLFYEDTSWQLEYIPRTQGNLLTSLVMATRFKYELLERYRGELNKEITEEKVEQVCNQILQTIWRIEEEADSRGMLDKEALSASFSTKEDQEVITWMFEQWYIIRNQLIKDLEKRDCEEIEQHLSRLGEINKRYLSLATGRYAEVMAES